MSWALSTRIAPSGRENLAGAAELGQVTFTISDGPLRDSSSFT
jgi:hypothetical protein